MNATITRVRTAAVFSLVAFQFSCGGSDGTGPSGPATITANSATTLSGSPGAPVQEKPSVVVRDQSGTPLAGVMVTYAVTSGGGSLTGAFPVTNASGVATVESWTLGTVGPNTVSASVGTLTPIVFTAISTDPCIVTTPHNFGTTTNGELTTADCRLQSGHYLDVFSTTVSPAGVFVLTQVAGFDAFLVLYGSDGYPIAFDDDESATSTNSRAKAFLPPGNYFVGATSYDPGTTGTYAISSASTSSAVTNCEVVFAARGITTAQNLETTDCLVNGFYSDDIFVYLRAGQTINLSMTSSAFDAFLELLAQNGAQIAFNDNADATTHNAQLTYTATADGFFRVVPRSAVAGVTGAYVFAFQ